MVDGDACTGMNELHVWSSTPSSQTNNKWVTSVYFLRRYRILDEYPTEPFTEVYWIKFQKINSARYCVQTVHNFGFGFCRNVTYVNNGHVKQQFARNTFKLRKTCTKLVLNKTCSAKSSKKSKPFISWICKCFTASCICIWLQEVFFSLQNQVEKVSLILYQPLLVYMYFTLSHLHSWINLREMSGAQSQSIYFSTEKKYVYMYVYIHHTVWLLDHHAMKKMFQVCFIGVV